MEFFLFNKRKIAVKPAIHPKSAVVPWCRGVVTWRRGVVVITTAQLHSINLELRLSAGSNPARGVSEICDGGDLWQWSRLEIRLNVFRRLTIPQKQFFIIIIIIIIKTITVKILKSLIINIEFESLKLLYCSQT